MALDGAPIVGDAIPTSDDVARRFAAGTSTAAAADAWGSEVKNPSVAYVGTGDQVLVLPDPLGAALVFIYRAPRCLYASSSLTSLVEVASTLGEAPAKDLEFQVERSVVGNGGYLPTSYRGVSVLPPGTWAAVSSDGLTRTRYSCFEADLALDASVPDLFEAARRDLLESISAVARLQAEARVAHLTGGFDSRMVLAGILASGREEMFRFFTSGPIGTVDRDISDQLSGHFGLRRTQDPGLATFPLEDVHARFLEPMRTSGGLTPAGPTGRELRRSVAVVGGGYGGLLRGLGANLDQLFAGAEGEPSDGAVAQALWGSQALADDGLIAPQARAALTERGAAAVRGLLDDGYAPDQLGNAHYLHYRNRYHFGQSSMLWNHFGSRFDPLYSRAGVRLARLLPAGPRNANVVGFDLLMSLAPDLGRLPFDKPRYEGDFSLHRRAPTPLEPRPGSFKTAAGQQLYSAPAAPGITAEQRGKYVDESRRIGVHYWQVAQMRSTQKALKGYLGSIDSSELSAVLNMDYARHLATQRLRRRSEIRHLYSVYSMLLWYFEG